MRRGERVERRVREIVVKLRIDAMHWAARYNDSVYLSGSTLNKVAPRDCDIRITLDDHDFGLRYGMAITKFEQPRNGFGYGVNWGFEAPTQRWVDDIAKFSSALTRRVGNVDLQIWPASYWREDHYPKALLLAAPSREVPTSNRFAPVLVK